MEPLVSEINSEEDRALFERYLAVCNEAIRRNADRFPFKQILAEAGRCAACGQAVEVLIIDDQPEHGLCIQYADDRPVVVSAPPAQNVKHKKWRVTRSYLLNVVHDPEQYIRNPAKIDWAWLYGLRDQDEQDEQSIS